MKKTTDCSPIVSVVVPVYRAERYIERCVKSILDQTESDIELWLIDDGSPDRCGDICDAFAQADARVHVLHKQNAGVSAARNDGIARASGKYVAFVDADDYIEPDMLSSLIKLSEQTTADISICGYYLEHTQEQKTAKLCCGDGVYCQADVKKLFSKFFGKDCSGLASMWNKLYLRSFLKAQNIRVEENLQRAEDFWFNVKAIKHAACISVTSAPLYHYVQNEESVMHRYRETQFDDWTQNRKRLLALANEHEISLQSSDFYFRYVYNSVLFLRQILSQSNYEKFYEIIQNPFLRQAIEQTSGLPLHIKMIALCINRKFYHPAKLLLKIWTVCFSKNNV